MVRLKKVLSIAVVACLMMTMLVGCGNKTETPAAGGDDPVGDPIVLKVAHHEPAASDFNKAWEEFAKQLEEKTNGQCKLELYPAEQLGKGADMVSMVTNNITDIGWIVAAFFPGQFPVTEVLNLPMLGVPNSVTASKSLWQLYGENEDMQKEWAQGMHLITFSASGSQFLATKDKKVVVPDDAKGLKIRVAGSMPSRFIEAIGASPVSMPPPDMYEALDKGVIDGAGADWNMINSFKFKDVLKYAMDMPLVSVPHGIVMNQQVWDGLPDDIKKAFDELGGEAGTQLFGGAFDNSEEAITKDFLSVDGREVVAISDADQAKWQEAAKPVWDEWIANSDKLGLDGKAILEKFQGFVKANS